MGDFSFPFPFFLDSLLIGVYFLSSVYGVILFLFFIAGVVILLLVSSFCGPVYRRLCFLIITPCITPTLYMLNDLMGVGPGLF
jgi:hypothetical protein